MSEEVRISGGGAGTFFDIFITARGAVVIPKQGMGRCSETFE